MKRTSIAALLILVVWLSIGCNKGKDWVSPNGTKMYGDLTLQDGTRRLIRVEYPDGHTEFDITTLPDGSEKIRRIELPNGQKDFDVIRQNGFYKVVRREFRDGEKQFNVTHLPDGTQKIERSELPNGEKRLDVTLSADGVASVGRTEHPKNSEPQPQQSQREPTTPKLLDNYPEYAQLRNPDLDKVIASLPEYQRALADRDALVKAKIGNISDPELRDALVEETKIPEVSKDDFRKLAEKKIAEERAAFLAAHKDCYFILGTYELYLPHRQMAIFNLKKQGGTEHAKDFVKSNGFGQSMPYRDGYYIGVLSDYRESALLMPMSLSSRYTPDWLTDEDIANYGVLVPITPEQMDSIYVAVRAKFSAQMNGIYATEMTFGGNTLPDGSFWKYCEARVCDALKQNIESFVRRQSIWILAQGDPMDSDNIRVDKAWVVVGGPDIFVTLK
ncbi:MAG TPA: hypothetical protein VJX47_04795 [Candidatus Sulfotelmatobacter sp.]|nr:hypothetical protein [Candidatus Sulfotelmatobacter sp.]